MPIFPRPASPRGAASDLLSYLTQNRAHKWPLLGLSAAITWVIVWAFIVDANTNTMPRRDQIIYIENWAAKRNDVAIILQQKKELMEQEAMFHAQQQKMQRFADAFGVEWRADAKRNAVKRAEAIRRINAALDARLAEAESKVEAQSASTPRPAAATPALASPIFSSPTLSSTAP
ncbi:MAG: hypothetical protein ABI395_01430 [Sphingobium sp.]